MIITAYNFIRKPSCLLLIEQAGNQIHEKKRHLLSPIIKSENSPKNSIIIYLNKLPKIIANELKISKVIYYENKSKPDLPNLMLTK
jgi:hypothetical protein